MLATATPVGQAGSIPVNQLHDVNGKLVQVRVLRLRKDSLWLVEMTAGSSVQSYVSGPLESATSRAHELFRRFFPGHECVEECRGV
jgi:hypothetical protein